MRFKRSRAKNSKGKKVEGIAQNDMSAFFYWESPGIIGKIQHALKYKKNDAGFEVVIDFDPPGRALDSVNSSHFNVAFDDLSYTGRLDLQTIENREDGAQTIRAICEVSFSPEPTVDFNNKGALWIGIQRSNVNAHIPFYRGIYLPTDDRSLNANPSDELQKRTMGWSDGEKFELKGFSDAHLLKKIYGTYTESQGDPQTILDFGCGAGRVLKYLPLSFCDSEAFIGTEIDYKQVDDFKTTNSNSRVDMVLTDIKPPISLLANETVGFAYALSVFTHMRLEDEIDWLNELARVLKQDGIAVVSIMSLGTLGWAKWMGSSFPNDFQLKLLQNGRDSSGLNLDIHDSIKDSEYYRNTYHTSNYIMDKWLEYFDILDILPYAFGYQDAVVLRKR
jgi:SAM-dependent methyltransferase